jgi:hypothetical protein
MAPAFTASGHKAKTEIFDEFRLGTFSHSRGHKAPPGFVTAAAGSPSKRPCWWAAMSHVWYGRRPVQEECDYQRSVRVQPRIRAYECSRFEKCTHKKTAPDLGRMPRRLKAGSPYFCAITASRSDCLPLVP